MARPRRGRTWRPEDLYGSLPLYAVQGMEPHIYSGGGIRGDDESLVLVELTVTHPAVDGKIEVSSCRLDASGSSYDGQKTWSVDEAIELAQRCGATIGSGYERGHPPSVPWTEQEILVNSEPVTFEVAQPGPDMWAAVTALETVYVSVRAYKVTIDGLALVSFVPPERER